MNSLFVKILLWFWATLIITTLGSAYLFLLAVNTGNHYPPLSRLVTFEMKEATAAYESGGLPALQQFQERFRSVFAGRGILTDAAGRDVLTGADESALIARVRREQRYPPLGLEGAVFSRRSDDGKYWFFFIVPPERLGTWFLLPQHWWGMAAGVVLCYLLAFYLTRPVRQLQRAVERFGRGDFSARAASARGDELGTLARTFDHMADRIQTLVDAERRLLLDISHELRSPLARLRVAVELARGQENREAALNRIDKEAERLNALVSQLLQVTRAEGDPGSLRCDPVQLDQLLRELAEESALEAHARGIDIRLAKADPAVVAADAELLRRAIENVIRNAIRPAPDASAVECSVEAVEGRAVVRIRDYGAGVPEDALPRLFDAFYRVDTARDRASGGVGLGLSIARRAIELHKGRISARNAHPGLEVEIELPRSS